MRRRRSGPHHRSRPCAGRERRPKRACQGLGAGRRRSDRSGGDMAVSIAICARPPARSRALFLYVGSLVLVNSLTAPTGIPAIPIQFYLKDHLHLLPASIALFGLVSGIPHYLSFVFGFVRDR